MQNIFNFGNWVPFIDKYYSQQTECVFPNWENDSRRPLVLRLEHLVHNIDGTLSSHYTWKNLKNSLREEIARDSYIDHNDFYIVASPEVRDLISADEFRKFATFCYVRRWNCRRKSKS